MTTLCELIFGTFSDQTPDIETYLGPEVLPRLQRVIGGQQIEIIGRFTQVLPNNWKMYAENVRDSYHASRLHLLPLRRLAWVATSRPCPPRLFPGLAEGRFLVPA